VICPDESSTAQPSYTFLIFRLEARHLVESFMALDLSQKISLISRNQGFEEATRRRQMLIQLPLTSCFMHYYMQSSTRLRCVTGSKRSGSVICTWHTEYIIIEVSNRGPWRNMHMIMEVNYFMSFGASIGCQPPKLRMNR
jgi:hypothetical protein